MTSLVDFILEATTMTRLSDLYVRARRLHAAATECARDAIRLLRDCDNAHVPPPIEACEAVVRSLAQRRVSATAAREVFAESYEQEIADAPR